MKLLRINLWYLAKLNLVIILSMMLSSCKTRHTTLCQSKSGKCISIEDIDDMRYIYYGQKSSMNYVKLDISKLDLELDCVFICWNNENNKLEIIDPKTKIVEVKLDTSIYQFSNTHELDSSSLPNILKFHKNGNIEFDMQTSSFFPLSAEVKLIKE